MGAPGKRIIRTSADWSCAGLVLSTFLAGRFTYRSEEQWIERINAGEITLNGKPVSPAYILQMHDCIEYHPQDIPEIPARLDYRIVFEDEHILVIDKPGNLCVHPSGPFYQNTLWYLLRQKYQHIHFVNRLDRETSGLLLAAKDAASAKKLSKNISGKKYQVIVHGDFPEKIDAAGFLLSANSIVRKKRRFVRELPDSPPFESAETRFRKLASDGNLSLVEAELFTGRMHQIRATLHSLGFPVAGDKLYGLDENFYLKQRSDELTAADREKLLLPRQALHSAFLEFKDISGEVRHFFSPIPEDMKNLIN